MTLDLQARLVELARQASAIEQVKARGLPVSAAFELLGQTPPDPAAASPSPAMLATQYLPKQVAPTTHHIGEYLKITGPNVPQAFLGDQAPARCPGAALTPTIEKIEDATAVKLFPWLTLEAFKQGKQAALALWHLARSLDRTGRGIVEVAGLKKFCRMVGMHPESFKRARRMAIECGLMVTRVARGVAVLELRGLVAVGKMFGLANLGAVPVYVPATFCARLPRFKAAAFAAFLEGRNKKTGPITRKTIQSLTDIPERTQQALAKRGRIRTSTNFAKSAIPAGDPNFVDGARSCRPGAFVIDDSKRKVLAWRLPNSYSTPFKRSNCGMLRKANASLRWNLFNCAGRGTDEVRRKRIFWSDRERAVKHREKDQDGRPMGSEAEPWDRYASTRWITEGGARIWQLVGHGNW